MGTVSTRFIHIERTRIGIRVRLARPDHYNALDHATLHCLDRFLCQQREPLPLILEGDPEFFSVGADIAELSLSDQRRAANYSLLGHRVAEGLEAWPGVTISFISGFCLGAGLELAMSCDVIVATPTLRAGLPGLAWAMVPSMGGLRRLACRVSEAFSADLFLGGELIDADQALACGLVDRLVHHDLEVTALAAEMEEFSPQAVQAIRGLRLADQGVIDPQLGSRMFATPFANGECQRRLRHLMAS